MLWSFATVTAWSSARILARSFMICFMCSLKKGKEKSVQEWNNHVQVVIFQQKTTLWIHTANQFQITSHHPLPHLLSLIKSAGYQLCTEIGKCILGVGINHTIWFNMRCSIILRESLGLLAVLCSESQLPW